MFSRLYNFWQLLRGNLWFIPGVFCLVYSLITLGLFWFEDHFFPDLELPSFLFNGTVQDAKAVTLALLAAMITMVTLVISITMVALSMSASQLGPRLIKSFMADRKTQIYIGIFFGSVFACFMLTFILHGSQIRDNIPRISACFVYGLCFANLFVLLGFVHHVSRSSIADNVVLKVSHQLSDNLRRLTAQKKNRRSDFEDVKKDWPESFENEAMRIPSQSTGYVQNIDYDRMVAWASNHQVHLKVLFHAGFFLMEGENCMELYPAKDLNEDVLADLWDSVIIGKERTPTQDLEYSIRHLVEIATRALSPGINDSFTAILVVDQLAAALTKLFQREVPGEWILEKNGTCRVFGKQLHECEIVFNAFNQIRHHGRDTPLVVECLLERLATLFQFAETNSQAQGLKTQVQAIQDHLQRTRTYFPYKESMLFSCAKLLEMKDS